MDRMEALVNTIIVERDGWKREALELRQDRADALRMVSRERERTTGPLVEGLPLEAAARVHEALVGACLAAQVEPCTPHGLRRPASMLTGHSVQVLLESYVRPDAARLRDAVRRAGLGVEERGTVIRLRGGEEE